MTELSLQLSVNKKNGYREKPKLKALCTFSSVKVG